MPNESLDDLPSIDDVINQYDELLNKINKKVLIHCHQYNKRRS